jgi:hypothetical protein
MGGMVSTERAIKDLGFLPGVGLNASALWWQECSYGTTHLGCFESDWRSDCNGL